MIEVKVVERTKFTRKFQIRLGDEIFEVSVDKRGKVWVAGQKIKSDFTFTVFMLGETKAEIYTEYYLPFGSGLKSLWLKIENQTAYFERNRDPRAQRIESVLTNIVYAGMGCLFGVYPILAIAWGLTHWILSSLNNFAHLGIDGSLLKNISGIVGLIFGIHIFYRIMWGGVSKDALVEEKDIVQLEQEYCYDGLPFGYRNDEWEEFKAKLQPEDEIWLWRTPEITWKMLTGREGLVIVRNDKTTRHTILTGMN